MTDDLEEKRIEAEAQRLAAGGLPAILREFTFLIDSLDDRIRNAAEKAGRQAVAISAPHAGEIARTLDERADHLDADAVKAIVDQRLRSTKKVIEIQRDHLGAMVSATQTPVVEE